MTARHEGSGKGATGSVGEGGAIDWANLDPDLPAPELEVDFQPARSLCEDAGQLANRAESWRFYPLAWLQDGDSLSL